MTAPAPDRVVLDIIARDFATAVVSEVRREFDRMGREAQQAGRTGAAGMDTLADGARRADRQVKQSTDNMSKGTSGVMDGFKSLAAFTAAGIGFDRISEFGKSAVNIASDMNETGTKLEAVFGDGTAAINAFAEAGPKALGQSSLALKDAAATFGIFGKAAGLAGADNAKFSTDLVKLSTDLASFYNASPEEAVEAIGAGLRGEAEPMRRFGVLMDDASLKAKALSMGLVEASADTAKIESAQLKAEVAQRRYNEAVSKNGKESTQAMSAQAGLINAQNAVAKATEGKIDTLTNEQRVLAAQALIMEQTAVAQGDFEKTSAGLANQQRILAAQWTNAKGKLGEVFLPYITQVVTAVNERLFPILDSMIDRIPGVIDKVKLIFGVLTTGDYAGGLGEEDSFFVRLLLGWERVSDRVFGHIKEAWSVLVNRDFQGGNGIAEDSPFIDYLFRIRDTAQNVIAGIRTLLSGDFVGSQWRGVEEDDPIVDRIFRARELIGQAVEWIKRAWADTAAVVSSAWGAMTGGDKQAFYDSLGDAAETTKGFISVIYTLSQNLPSLNDILTLLGGVLGFVADNVDLLVAALPYLIAAWAAYRVSQIAANFAAVASLPIQAAQVASNFALARANNALALALGYTHVSLLSRIGSMIASTASLIAHTAATVASTVATWAVRGAMLAWTAAQWLLNAAVAAFPILAIVAAVAALVAGVVWAYNNVDWFREAVDAAWEGIKTAFTWAWENVIKPVFNWIVEAAQNTGDWFSKMYTEYVEPALSAIGSALTWYWENVVSPYLTFWWNALQKVGDFFNWLGETAQNVVDWISGKLTEGYNWMNTNVFIPLGVAIGIIGSFLSGLWDTASEVWDNIGTKVSDIWNGTIKPIWESLQEFIKGIGEFFDGIFKGVESAVKGVAGFITDIIESVKGFFTDTVEFEPVSAQAMASVSSSSTGGPPSGGIPSSGSQNPFALPGTPNSADGGPVMGHGGPRQDNLPYWLSSGEFVINARATAKHLPLIEAINADGLADGGLVGTAPAIAAQAQQRIQGILEARASYLVKAEGDAKIAAEQARQASMLGGGGYFAAGSGNWGPENYSGLAANAAAAKAFITQKWGITNIGGWRAEGSVASSDHPKGKALDVMIANYLSQAGIAQGTSVADWFRSNPNVYGTKYVIWRDRIDNMRGAGWEGYSHPGGNDDNLAHRNHVHISFLSGGSEYNPMGQVAGDAAAAIQKLAGGLWNASGSGLPGSVTRWAPMAEAALRAFGYGSEWVTPMLWQMLTESTGNPNAINLTDSNARRGTPSKGLLQTIDSTFRANLMGTPYANLISRGPYDPWANMLAAVSYVQREYGGPGVWRKAIGGNPNPYDNGGLWPTGTLGINLTGGTEAVLTPQEKEAYQTTAKAYAAGQGGGRGDVTIEAGAVQITVQGDLVDPAATRAALEAALREILQDNVDRSFMTPKGR